MLRHELLAALKFCLVWPGSKENYYRHCLFVIQIIYLSVIIHQMMSDVYAYKPIGVCSISFC